ncbi:hypothetical protein P154DRAFT_523684 [Amniculicola lignicola CBS 123094]|uniref:Uncharacterized protein n=1 Tax=Amniculicola lignicola CBS 123094 TaxID=1392246 RepID=A0A6A5WB00_9PLEO|nr:hypothetical protein P154DRAFT_523684 [Amniculicola lignicola CBS 123094]
MSSWLRARSLAVLLGPQRLEGRGAGAGCNGVKVGPKTKACVGTCLRCPSIKWSSRQRLPAFGGGCGGTSAPRGTSPGAATALRRLRAAWVLGFALKAVVQPRFCLEFSQKRVCDASASASDTEMVGFCVARR